MEQGTIERDIHVDASPEVVFEVVSQPEHMREWWPDDARFESVAGAPGELVWRNADTGETTTVALAVVEVDPPKRFSFRWCFTEPDRSGQALLVTFDLIPDGTGTQIRMTETGSARWAGRSPSWRRSTRTTRTVGTTTCPGWARTSRSWSPPHEYGGRRRAVVGDR